MTKTIKISEKDKGLQKIVTYITEGVEVILTAHDKPIARILPYSKSLKTPRIPGLHENTMTYMTKDFDDPLDDNFWLAQE